jgi:hypothetical protein
MSSRGSDLELAYASPNVLRLQGGDPEGIERHTRKHASNVLSDEEDKRAQTAESAELGAPVTMTGILPMTGILMTT